jgi:hypothetical protein
MELYREKTSPHKERIVYTTSLRYALNELLAQAEASGAYPLPSNEREWIDAPAVGRELI